MHASFKKMNSPKTVVLVLGTILMLPVAHARDVTIAQWLADQPKPAYKADHSLPRLTRYAYSMPVAARIELCENWGYALEYGSENGTYVGAGNEARLDDKTTPEAQIAALAKSDPARYPLVVVCDRRMPSESECPEAFVHDANGKIFHESFKQADGTVVEMGGVYSLAAPASVWEMAGEFRAEPFRKMLDRGIPISMVLNGGEYPGFPGGVSQSMPFLTQDAELCEQVANSPWGPGNWNNFNSAKGAEIEKIIARKIYQAIPYLSSYNHYTSGGRTERNRFWGIDEYGGYWEHVRGTNVLPGGEDIPSNQHYVGAQNTGFTVTDPSADMRNKMRDILTQALNSVGICIATGNPFSYDWISAGWGWNTSDVNRWAGFLKCIYTAGTIGTNTGAYEGPPMNGTYIGHTFSHKKPPEYAKNLAVSAYIHALFSHLDTFTRNSDLLPGPMPHALSPQEPAYEFPTGDDTARVLARKHRTEATWLVTAWAAAGADRNVSVYIPELGQLTVEARITGSVYKAMVANGKKALIRLDDEGARYTAVANGKPVVTDVNLAIPAIDPAECLFWVSADQGVKADAAGKVSAWASQGSKLTLTQPDSTKRPKLIPDAINGKPALRFENTKTWLTIPNAGALGEAFVGGVEAIAVFKPTSSEGNQAVVSGIIAGGDDYAGDKGFRLNNQTSTSIELKDGLSIKAVTGNFKKPLYTLNVGDGTASAGPGFNFGLTGDIAEILIYKSHSKSTQGKVLSYLRTKYGFSVARPIINDSFEAPRIDGFMYNPGAENNQKIGWVFASAAMIQSNGSIEGAEEAPNGSQTAVLTAVDKNLGCIAQTLLLDAGTYTIRFKAARQPDGGMQPLKFCIDNIQLGEPILPASSDFAEYKTSQFTVLAGQHVLRIEATNREADKSTFIDQIELVQSAAPANAK